MGEDKKSGGQRQNMAHLESFSGYCSWGSMSSEVLKDKQGENVRFLRSSVPLKITRDQCYQGQLGPTVFCLPILSDPNYL